MGCIQSSVHAKLVEEQTTEIQQDTREADQPVVCETASTYSVTSVISHKKTGSMIHALWRQRAALGDRVRFPCSVLIERLYYLGDSTNIPDDMKSWFPVMLTDDTPGKHLVGISYYGDKKEQEAICSRIVSLGIASSACVANSRFVLADVEWSRLMEAITPLVACTDTDQQCISTDYSGTNKLCDLNVGAAVLADGVFSVFRLSHNEPVYISRESYPSGDVALACLLVLRLADQSFPVYIAAGGLELALCVSVSRRRAPQATNSRVYSEGRAGRYAITEHGLLSEVCFLAVKLLLAGDDVVEVVYSSGIARRIQLVRLCHGQIAE